MHFEGSPDEVECAGNDLRRAERLGWEGGVTLLQCILKLPVNDSMKGGEVLAFAPVPFLPLSYID